MNTTQLKNNEDKAMELKFDITKILQEEIGFNEYFASQVAEAFMRGLRKKLGGQDIYIPASDKALRNAAIKKEFNGNNIDAICKKYCLSQSAIYKIVGK